MVVGHQGDGVGLHRAVEDLGNCVVKGITPDGNALNHFNGHRCLRDGRGKATCRPRKLKGGMVAVMPALLRYRRPQGAVAGVRNSWSGLHAAQSQRLHELLP